MLHDLDKVIFKERKLRIRFHVPFTPGSRFPRIGSIKRKTKIGSTNLCPPASVEGDGDGDSGEFITSAGNTPRPTDPLAPSAHLQFSNTVLFVKGMRHKVKEEKIMLYFKEFNPMEVIIQKPRGIIKGLKSRACHALVLFDLPLGVTLDRVIADCKSRIFDGGYLTLVRAFALREKLFSLQSPAEGAGLRIDGVVLSNDVQTEGSSLATPTANTGCWYSDDEAIEPVPLFAKPVAFEESTKNISFISPTNTKDAKNAKDAKDAIDADGKTGLNDDSRQETDTSLDVLKSDNVNKESRASDSVTKTAKTEVSATLDLIKADRIGVAALDKNSLAEKAVKPADAGSSKPGSEKAEQALGSLSNAVGKDSLTDTAVESRRQRAGKPAEFRIEAPQAVVTQE